MTHAQAIETLLHSLEAGAARDRGAQDRRLAEEHVVECSDCWHVVRLLYELVRGAPPAGADRMTRLFGCEGVQAELYLLDGLTASEVRRRHPEIARHLGWCRACGSRLATILEVERQAKAGEFPAMAPSRSCWREVPAAGDRVLELLGRAVMKLRSGALALAELPEGLYAFPVTAGAVRGGEATALDVAPEHELRFALGDSGTTAALRIRSQGKQHVSLEVRLQGAAGRARAIRLRAAETDDEELLAARTTRGEGPVTWDGLGPGSYVVEVHERPTHRYRLRIDLEADAPA